MAKIAITGTEDLPHGSRTGLPLGLTKTNFVVHIRLNTNSPRSVEYLQLLEVPAVFPS
jgi:hypothetical protein